MREHFATVSPIIDGLQNWIEPQRDKIIAKMCVGARSREYVNIITGVKRKADLNLLTTNINFRQAACGFDATSSQALSNRVIEVGNIQIQLQYCDKQLISRWGEWNVVTAADKGANDMPFAEYFMNALIENVQIEVEKAFWMGNKTSGTGNLAFNDGICTILQADATTIDKSALATKIQMVNETIVAIPRAAKEKGIVRIYMSPEFYEAYMLELVQANLYHYDPNNFVSRFEYYVPGTNIIATSCPGMMGAKYIIGANQENLYWGTDLEGDQEVLDFWFSQDDRNFKADIEFNIGAQVAYPDLLAFVKIAA